jgi:hypothetical protein
MLPKDQNQGVAREPRDLLAKDLISMTSRSTYASGTSKLARLTAALGRAWQGARLADRQVMEIRTKLSRHGS